MAILRKGRLLVVLATAFALGGCAAMRRHEARDTGDLLVSAGFATKPADTPERAQQLGAMPPLKLVSQSKDGHVVYRYADPYSCHCLYVGDQQAYPVPGQPPPLRRLTRRQFHGEREPNPTPHADTNSEAAR